jgi:hypothetical protein
MEPERDDSLRKWLKDTNLPESEVGWLAANDIHTLGDLIRLSLIGIEQLKGYNPSLLAPLCLMALIEGVSIGGMTPVEMRQKVTSILGPLPHDPKVTLEILQDIQDFYNPRSITTKEKWRLA